jgi:hypothetical protein
MIDGGARQKGFGKLLQRTIQQLGNNHLARQSSYIYTKTNAWDIGLGEENQ